MLGMFRLEEVGREGGGYRDFLMLLSLRVARVTLYLVVVLVHIPLYLSMGVIVSSLILSRNTLP